MTIYPSVYLGTILAETIRTVGIVPRSGDGVIVRGFDLFTMIEIALGPTDYWVVELGTIAGQMEFTARYSYSTPYQGLAKGRTEVAFPKPISYTTGEVMALRAYPVGSPASLTLFEVVVRVEAP